MLLFVFACGLDFFLFYYLFLSFHYGVEKNEKTQKSECRNLPLLQAVNGDCSFSPAWGKLK